MSNKRRNNHYHYAEKFDVKREHSRSGRSVFVPFKALLLSLIVLLLFGFVTTTFGAYVTESLPEDSDMMVQMRNIKASRDVALTGADMDLAETGWGFSGTNYFYFDNTTSNWSGTIQLLIGKSNYTSVYAMTKVTNTNYYVVQLSNAGWNDAEYMAVIAADSTWGSGSWGPSNRTNASKYTNTYTSGCDASNNQRYLLTPGSSSNNCTLSLTYKGTDNSSMDTVTLKAHACYSTTGASNSYTADNSTGGTVNITSYYFSAYNAVSSSSTGATNTASYDAAKTTSGVTSTFAAVAASGYRFIGWFTAANGGSSVSSNANYTYSTNSGDKEIYARFIKRVTITPAKNPTAYTGSPTAGGNTSSYTCDVNTAVTLNADVKTGVTFGGWTFSNNNYSFVSGYSASSNPTQIKPTANLTATAKYTLQTPTIGTFSYADSAYVEGGTAMTPSKTATSAAGSSGSLSYAYSFVSGGTGPSNGYSLNTSTGAFSATVAGTYKIRLTVTDTAYGLTSAAATKDYTVTVRPAAITGFSYTVTGQNSGAGTVAEPWKVPVNSTTFAITSYIPEEERDANYTYNWTRSDGTYLISNGNRTAGSCTATTSSVYLVTDTASAGTATTDVIHNWTIADTQGFFYKVSVTRTRNGVTGPAYDYYFYYGVTADFLVVNSFDFSDFNSTPGEEVQKIYAEDNGIDEINADYEAGGTLFHTMLWFSNDNITANQKKVAVWTPSAFTITSGNPFAGTHSALPSDAAHQVSSLITELSTIARNSVNLMSTTGPKWFKGYVDDYNNPRIGAQYPELHTTVGTSSGSADRPIYYIDNTGSTYTECRVMAFYVLDGETEVHYQTAQTPVDGRYRFYIPTDAKYIIFAHVAENSYVLPTFSGGSFSMTATSDYLKAWTATVDLTDDANVGKNVYTATAKTTSNGINNYTGSMGTLS